MNSMTLRNNSPLAKGQASKLAKQIKAKRARGMQAAANINRVVLLDRSGSMGAADATDMAGLPATRAGALESAWAALAPLGKGRMGAYVFGSKVTPVRGSASGKAVRLPGDGGSTSMCEALTRSLIHRHPQKRVLVVSDGCPTDGGEADAIACAKLHGCPVDTVYVGPVDPQAQSLMRNIATATGGTYTDMARNFDASRFLSAARTWLLEK